MCNFLVTFPTHPKNENPPSVTQDIAKKQQKMTFDNRTNLLCLEKGLGMSYKCEICAEIRVMQFPLMCNLCKKMDLGQLNKISIDLNC